MRREMAVYAIVRRTTYDVDRLARAEAEVQEFQRLHAEQPGYAGNVIMQTSPETG